LEKIDPSGRVSAGPEIQRLGKGRCRYSSIFGPGVAGCGAADHGNADRQRRCRLGHSLGRPRPHENGAAISTEAETSTASGGNITLKVGDLLYLKNGEITTSAKGETGNDGNIRLDLQSVAQSNIIAKAIKGHGGNITIIANEFLQSADIVVSATSQLGIYGTIEIIGPRVDLNGALVVLSSKLRSAVQVLRNSCAVQAGLPQFSPVKGGGPAAGP
jgi:hypothetical protein